MRAKVAFIFSWLVLFSSVIHAQDTPKTKSFCFRGRPLPECRYFMLTEFSILYRFAGTPESELPMGVDVGKTHLSWDLGLMRNLNEKHALGGSVFVALDGGGSRLGIKPRYRYWFNQNTSLDISGGVLLANSSDFTKTPGYLLGASLGYKDYFSLMTQIDVIPYEGTIFLPGGTLKDTKKNRVSGYVGAKLGSKYAITGTALVAILAVIVAATWHPFDY